MALAVGVVCAVGLLMWCIGLVLYVTTGGE